MIAFDGIAIESVAPVMIEDIRVAPIRYNPVVRPRAIRFGSEFVRMGGGERTITISFAVLVKNTAARHEALMALSQWAKTDAEHMLELPQDPLRFLQCVCTAKPEPSTRAWWENKLKLVFTCYDNPYWTSKKEKVVACGTAFRVMGDAPPLMRIVRNGNALANVTYSNGLQSMQFTSIPAGAMIIDLNAQTAQVSGQSIMQFYQPSGSFLVPFVGNQTISGTGTVNYRERWE